MEEMKPDLIIIDELILMDIVLEKMAGDTPSIFTKSISEFEDIPFIVTGEFFSTVLYTLWKDRFNSRIS